MAGGKETPRQKMIGMMYLVLTALLALNVSKEILNAFVIVNNSLQETTTILEEVNDQDWAKFESSMSENPAKTKRYFDAAKQIREEATLLVNHVQNIKIMIIKETEKLETDEQAAIVADSIMAVNGKDNYDIPTEKLGLAEPANPKDFELSAVDLRKRIEAFKDKVIKNMHTADPRTKNDINEHSLGLNTKIKQEENGVVNGWEQLNFYHLPIVACLTNLSKIQTDVRNIESQMIKKLYSSVDAGSFKFNKLAPLSVPKSAYVLQGDTFQTEIFLAAYDTTKAPNIFIGKFDSITLDPAGTEGTDYFKLKVDPSGKGIYTSATPDVGVMPYGGVIHYPDPIKKGEFRKYAFKDSYTVAKPSATVSATKMNVLYIGVDNPLSISAAGVAEKDIKASLSGGSLSRKGKEWIARVKRSGNASVNVNANVNGQSVKMGSMKFRVKRVPDPVATIGSVEGEGTMAKNKLKVLPGLSAKMKNFDFDLRFRITGFEMVAAGKGIESIPFKSNNGSFTSQMKKVFASLSKGNKVYFQQIRAKGPDGSTRKLAPIALTIK